MVYNPSMKEMSKLIAEHEMEVLLGYIHAKVALVESDGTLVSWNPAFEVCKKISPSVNKLEECFTQKDRHLLALNLSRKTQNRCFAELIVDGEGVVNHDCLIVPVLNERFLFIAEEAKLDLDSQEIIERLNRKVKLYKIESEFTKKLARNKQIEMESVMIQANELAHVDALTFLLNRRMIVRELQSEILRAQRYDSPLSISLVDIDHFKKINDAYGHLIGDEVLRQVAYQLRDHSRNPDAVGRYGGEEFLILLPNTISSAAEEQAERLSKHVRETMVDAFEHSLKVTISIGIAQYQMGVDTWETLLKRADDAMYEAKKNGRDRWVVAG